MSRGVTAGYSAPVSAGGVPSSPHEPEDVSFGTAAGKKVTEGRAGEELVVWGEGRGGVGGVGEGSEL